MRYAQIRDFDISNGLDVGMSLFVQGCPIHCEGCFNPGTWDYNGGKEWNKEVENRFFKNVGRDYIKRISVLGGEPLCETNIHDVSRIISKLRNLYPAKKIWVYTGYVFDNLSKSDDMNVILNSIDVLVDGNFQYDKRDFTLRFRGSTNQRIIDVPKTLLNNSIILWNSNK